MDDAPAGYAMVVFLLGLPVGVALGGLVAWRKGFFWGAGIGAVLIGCVGLYGAATVGWQRYQSIAGTTRVQGSLVEFVEERTQDLDGRTVVSRAPVVEYTAADGQKRRVKGLAGGLSRKQWGDPVEVRYSVANPAQAFVADFQNIWGAVWGLGLFGGFPTMFGLFFIGTAISESRANDWPPQRHEPTPAQQRWRKRGTVLANMVLLAGFALAFFYPHPSPFKQIGVGFMAIGVGALLHFIVQSLPPATAFGGRSILAMVGLGFLGFGFGAWMMG